MQQVQLYQNLLHELSRLPVEYLQQVAAFISGLNQQKMGDKERNRQAILALAGSWSDLSEEDFQDVLTAAKDTGRSLFAREVDL